MSDQQDLSARITRLEECQAHQDHLVSQLNEVILELRVESERQQRMFEQKIQQLQLQIENVSQLPPDPNEKPPHY